MKRKAEIEYIEYWVIRVIRETVSARKECTKEIEFQTPPTEQDLIEVLTHCAPDEFISVAHNYRMDGRK